MKLIRVYLVTFTTFIMHHTVRLYGWTDAPKPTGFPNSPYRYWRQIEGTKQIACVTLPQAFQACALEAMKERL